MKNLGSKIKKIRFARNLTFEKFISCGIDKNRLEKIERGEFFPSLNEVELFAKVMNFNFSELKTIYFAEKFFRELEKEPLAIKILKQTKKFVKNSKFSQNKEIIINQIKNYVKKIPVEKVWIFGSLARNEWGKNSDIDILVEYQKNVKIDLFDVGGYISDLQALTGRKIDWVEDGFIKSFAKNNVEKEKILIYERETSR